MHYDELQKKVREWDSALNNTSGASSNSNISAFQTSIIRSSQAGTNMRRTFESMYNQSTLQMPMQDYLDAEFGLSPP